MDLNDDQMKGLRATLLAVGKGRRPSLPELRMDNKLLYPLHLLRQEANCPGKEVEKWFARLFPESTYPAERFCRHLDRVASKVQSLGSDEDRMSYFSISVDLDFISEALSKQGVNRHMDFSKFTKCQLTNEIVADLNTFVNKEKMSQNFLLNALNAVSSVPIVCSKSAFSRHIQKFDKVYKSMQTKNDKAVLESWRKDIFVLPRTTNPVSTADKCEHLQAENSVPVHGNLSGESGNQKAELQQIKILQQKVKDANACEEETKLKLETVRQMYSATADVHEKLQSDHAVLREKFHILQSESEKLKAQNSELKKTKSGAPGIKGV